MSHEGFSEGAYHKGETIIHSEFIYPVCSIIFSTELLWSPMKARLHFVFLFGTNTEKIKEEGSSPDIVQLNRLERIQCSLNVIWRKNKSFQVLEQPFTGVLRSAKNLGT